MMRSCYKTFGAWYCKKTLGGSHRGTTIHKLTRCLFKTRLFSITGIFNTPTDFDIFLSFSVESLHENEDNIFINQ